MKSFKLPSATWMLLLLFVLFAVGRWGFSQDNLQETFIRLIPFQLFFLAIVTALYQQPVSSRFLWVSLIWIVGGWSVEWLGVSTQFPFGPYAYKSALGWGPFGIPLMIGVNWWLLLTQINAFNGFRSFWMRTLFSAFLLTFTDWCLEPMAISLDYWQWHTPDGSIPWSNYAGWFAVSWIFSAIYTITGCRNDNFISFPLWILEILFFLSFRWI